MLGLTVTAKEYRRPRISTRIGKRIKAIKSKHPTLFQRVRREAHAPALASLGLAEAHTEFEQAPTETAAIKRRRTHAPRGTLTLIWSVPSEEITDGFNIRSGREFPLPIKAANMLAKLQDAREEELLAHDSVGAEIAHLEAEQKRLLDTICLAYLPAQINQLRSKRSARLDDERGLLGREPVAVAPLKED
jgi:hypothetical protein